MFSSSLVYSKISVKQGRTL